MAFIQNCKEIFTSQGESQNFFVGQKLNERNLHHFLSFVEKGLQQIECLFWTSFAQIIFKERESVFVNLEVPLIHF